MKKLLILIMIAPLFVSCFLSEIEKPGVVVDAQLATDLLNDAVDTIEFADNNYVFDAYLWRDFMPGTSDRSLRSINYLISSDSSSITLDLEMNRQYVINGDSIWIADYTDEHDSHYPHIQTRISRNGPEWRIGNEVDIVSKVSNALNGNIYYIKTENVSIEATH